MFKKATKEKAKLRLALFGVSGGGKTYSALRMATGLGEKIALIDTEHGTASKYADRFNFDVCDLDNPTINNVLMTMKEARDYDVLIIDSLSHAWEELLDEVNRIAKAKFGGNTWSAWSEGTPKQKKLIEAILEFPGHIIVTMRAETNWTTTVNDRGKVVPIRIGEAPRQGKNIEYEFDMLIQLSQDHSALVLKDRTGKFQDQCLQEIDEQFGKDLNDWLQDGETKSKSSVEVEDEMLGEFEIPFGDGTEETQSFDEVPRVDQDPILKMNDDDMIIDFKERTGALLNAKQIKLFMKQNHISVTEPDTLRKFLYDNDLELTIAKFLEEVEK